MRRGTRRELYFHATSHKEKLNQKNGTKHGTKMGQKIDFSTEFLPLMQLKTYQLWGRARVGIVIFCKLRKHSDARFARILVLSSNHEVVLLR